MDRIQAENKLGKVPGTYLVRYSKDAYVVSYVSSDANGKYMHIKALITASGLRVDSTSGKIEEFGSLMALTDSLLKRKLILTPVT